MATFLFAQSPNRKGNHSKHPPEHSGGATAETNPRQGGIKYGKGHVVDHPAPDGDVTKGRGQKVQLHKPPEYVNRKSTPYMDGANKAVKR